MQYTSEQTNIISHRDSHARIIAVAGSGKTQTLTAYVNQRLQQGANPKRILVLMYNKAAQLDFQRRLLSIVTKGDEIPDIRTFHSLGYRICQTMVRQGHMPSFDKKLLTDTEIEPIVWRLLRQLANSDIAEDILSRKKKWVEPAVAYFELVKSSLQTPEVVFEETGLPESCKLFIEVFYHFEDWRAQQQKMTFSDLIYEPVQRFIREPHLAKQFAGHMQEYIVDEFQDINPVQSYLLETLHGGIGQVMVVGDPDQTIYEFRGSKPSLLTNDFSDTYGDVTDYQLSHTFRFGDRLSVLANQVIAHNYTNNDKRTFCVSHTSVPDTLVKRLPVADCAQTALQCIQTWRQSRRLSDVVVINRLWANSARLELLMLANSIPYRMDNQQTVLERYELRPFRVLFQIASGNAFQWDTKTKRNAWQVLLTQPYLKIKKSIVDDLISVLSTKKQEWGRELRNAVPSQLSKYQSEALFERARWIEKAERAQVDAAAVVYGWIQSTEYFNALKDNAFSAAQVDDQIATVKAFATFVRQSQWSLSHSAEKIAELAARKTPDSDDAVLITSIHKSKGREWPCVIIPEVNSRFYPYQPDSEFSLPASVESERRLLYVAMTRAIEELVLLTPTIESDDYSSPLIPDGYVDGLDAFLSFLTDDEAQKIPANMNQESLAYYAQIKGKAAISWDVSSVSSDGLEKMIVSHPTLGMGQIVRESESRLWIQFLKNSQLREFDRNIVLPLLTMIKH